MAGGRESFDDLSGGAETAVAASPDLHPIENCWSKIKPLLRSLKPRSREALLDVLAKAFSSITTQDIRGWFNHCGYRVAHTCQPL